MSFLSKLIAPALDAWRKAFTPPPVPSTDRELSDAEREIEAGAELVESNVRAGWVRTARSWVGKGRYCLGAGAKAGSKSPLSACAKPKEHGHEHLGNVFCDCSGFVCFIIGIPRKNADGTWNNTDHLEKLAKRQGIKWTEAQPGDVVVYGAGAAVGHCGLVSEVDDAGPCKVIHCNAGTPPAIDETDESLFARKGALIWRPPVP